ncbi:MAG: RNA 3'-terminal phosphate cyclase [Chloroflexota bacterium]|nr:RNA 3'-terminal phosphate cyclase [Chloroflexota bacterium]
MTALMEKGGGQVLRSSLTLSALTVVPIIIHDIRANRSQPGLRHQNLAAVNTIAKITQDQVEGKRLDSTFVQFVPDKPKGGTYQFNISKAGARSGIISRRVGCQ